MPKFNIWCGMGGGFNNVTFRGTYEYADEAEAYRDAWALALEDYQGYEGSHGILSWEEVKQDIMDSWPEEGEPSDEEVDDAYCEAVDGWVSVRVAPYVEGEEIPEWIDLWRI